MSSGRDGDDPAGGSEPPSLDGPPSQADRKIFAISEADSTSFADVEGGVPSLQTNQGRSTKRLSTRSKSYDYFNRGELDDTQKAIMKRDNSGRGYLKNEEIYELMQEHLTTGQQIMKYRVAIMVLIAFTVILAISNLGTSFGAATMVKDTATEGNNLIEKTSHKVVAVQSASEQYTVLTSDSSTAEGGAEGASNRVRREAACTKDKASSDLVCVASTFSLRPSDAEEMIESCKLGRVVVLTRNFDENRSLQLPICPVATGYHASYSRGGGRGGGKGGGKGARGPTATLGSPKGTIEIKPGSSGGGKYVVEGNGITSDEGEFCDNASDCDDLLDCDQDTRTCSDGSRGSEGGKGPNSVSRADLTKFAAAIVDQAKRCPRCAVEEVFTQALEEIGVAIDNESKASQYMEALNDNSTDMFDNAKIALIERNGEHTACEASSAPSARGLCKSDAKKEATDVITSNILGSLQAAEARGEDPNLESIVENLEMELGVTDVYLNQLLKDDSTAIEEIKGHRDSAESKVADAITSTNAMEVNNTLNMLMDNGKDLVEAVSASGFTDEAIEEAFRFFEKSDPGTIDELNNKGGTGKRQRAKDQLETAYTKRGWTKRANNGVFTPFGGGTGSRWEKGQEKGKGKGGPGAANADEEVELGEFYTGEDGRLYFDPPADGTFRSFEAMKKDIEDERGTDGSFRRLTDGYIQDSHDLQTRLNSRAKALHRHLSGLTSICSDSPEPLGCFEDNAVNRDLPHFRGSVNSVQACLDACHGEGFLYAGLQSGSTCYCGGSFGSHGQSESCSLSCLNGGTCGGSSANTIYEYVAYENIDCVARNLDELADNLLVVTGTVSSAIAPLTSLLDNVANGIELLKSAKIIGMIVQVALIAAGYIPYVGPVFTIAKTAIVDPIMKLLKIIVDKSSLFQKTVGNLWQLSLGKLSDVIDSMETSFVEPISSLAIGLSDIGPDQCAVSVLSELASVDVVGTADQAFGIIVDFIESLLSALTDISTILASSAWNAIQDTLQTVLDGVQPLFDFLKPLEPLAELLNKEIVLPWFQPPYSQKYLGEAYCKPNFYRGAWPNTCWESSTHDWEETSMVAPYHMTRTCESGSYSDRTLGGCWNEYYAAHTRGYYWDWGWKCPSGYIGSYWTHPLGCTQRCPSDRHMDTGWCYKKSCRSGFSADHIRCNPHQRLQHTHTAKCDRYSYDSDAHRYLADGMWEGECWQGCSSGDTDILGLCFPPAELRISISGIFDAFQAIIDFIMDLPLVSVIMDAIESVVSVVLAPVMDVLSSMGLTMPEFPTLELDALDLSFFDDFSFNVPSLPDMSQLLNLPETLMSSLPGVPSALATCGVDVGCLAEEIGVSDIVDNTLGGVGEILDVLDLETLKTDMFGLLSSLECTEWQDVTLPVEDLLTAIPGITALDNACDYTVPICSSFDLSGAQETIDNLLKPLFQNTPDRRLAESPQYLALQALFAKFQGSFALLNLEFPFSLATSFGRDSSSNKNSWKGSYTAGVKLLQRVTESTNNVENPGAVAVKVTPSLTFTAAPALDLCKGTFSVSVGASFSVAVASNKGNERLLRDALETAKFYHGDNIPSEYEKSIDLASECLNTSAQPVVWKFSVDDKSLTELCALKYGAVSVAKLKWHIKKPDLIPEIKDQFRESESVTLFGIKKMEEMVTGNNPDELCMIERMEKSLKAGDAVFWKSKEGWDHAWPCIQYWFKHKTFLEDLQERINAKIVSTTRTQVGAAVGRYGAHVWEQLTMVSFPSSLVRPAAEAAFEYIFDQTLPTPNNIDSTLFQGGTLLTTIGVRATHPYYVGTSIGLNLVFHSGLLRSIKSFDIGTVELRHLVALAKLGGGETPDSLKNGILKTWEWGASYTLAFSYSHLLFPFPGMCGLAGQNRAGERGDGGEGGEGEVGEGEVGGGGEVDEVSSAKVGAGSGGEGGGPFA